MKKQFMAYAVVTALFAVTLTGCSSFNDERGKGDAPVSGRKGDDTPKTVTNNPDGFGNVVTGCVAGAKGFRYFATTNTGNNPSNLWVERDPVCGAKADAMQVNN